MEHLEWISTNLRDRLSSPVQPGRSRKNPVSYTHEHQHASAMLLLPTHSFFPIKDYRLLLLTNFQSHIFYNELNISKYIKQDLFTHHFQLSSESFEIQTLNTRICLQKKRKFVFEFVLFGKIAFIYR